MLYLLFAVAILLAAITSADFVLYPPNTGNPGGFNNPIDAETGFGNVTAINAACGHVLNQTVACDARVQRFAAADYYQSLSSLTDVATICSQTCNASIVSYRQNINTYCGKMGLFDTYPNSWRGDVLFDWFSLACSKDSTSGQFCTDWLIKQMAAVKYTTLLDLPNTILCSSCFLGRMKTLQSSAFLGYDAGLASTYKQVQTRCSVTGPTDPTMAPQASFPNDVNSTSLVNITCASGKTYTAKAGDTCGAIALANSVAQGTLSSINNLDARCSGLRVGQSLCLPSTCQTLAIKAGGDCLNATVGRNLTFPQFLEYNPTINVECSNFDSNGTVVCVSPPDAMYIPVYIPGSNQTIVGEYADDVVPAPGPIPFGTTTNCGGWYKCQVADTCSRVSLAESVSVDLFEIINPSINAGCTNLIPDLWYCTHPIHGWNATSAPGNGTTTTATQAPPGPTATGTTGACYTWHVVVANDTCSFLEATLGVTMAQLLAWNTNLKSDCTNLILGNAYCVRGPALTSTTSTKVSTTSTTSRSSSSTMTSVKVTTTSNTSKPSSSTTTSVKTTTTTTAACTKSYTVVSGDYCQKIWSQFGLTEAQLRALNPILNANCDLVPGQVLCVGSGTTTSSIRTTTTK